MVSRKHRVVAGKTGGKSKQSLKGVVDDFARYKFACVEALEARRLLARTIYVDVTSTVSTPTGTAWATAYSTLQQGLAVAVSGDSIRVADGTYKPTTTTSRTSTFQLKSGVTVSGGYAGVGAANPDQRDVVALSTVLSGDIGTVGATGDNSYHVVTGSGVSATGTLDGFTISGGNANGTGTNQNSGGGMINVSGSPTVKNCIFSSNSCNGDPTPFGGGAVYNSSSSASFADCTFSANNAVRGGGIFNNAGSPTISNCTFIGNVASSAVGNSRGGAIYNFGTAAAISNCTFNNNSSTAPTGFSGVGGAVFNANPGALSITGCTFTANTATYGGAMGNNLFSGAITNCTFQRNVANGQGDTNGRGFGGAVFNQVSGTTPSFKACLFLGNFAIGGVGGAVYSDNQAGPSFYNSVFAGNSAGSGAALGVYGASATATSASTLINCTFSSNSGVGVILVTSSVLTATNCVFSADSIADFYFSDSFSFETQQINYCASDGYFERRNGNLSSFVFPPSFLRNPSTGNDGVWGTIDDDYGDLRAQASSPTIDKGDDLVFFTGLTTDIDGKSRRINGRVDMGAYENDLAADLIIRDLAIVPSSPRSGEEVQITWSESNQGTLTAVGNLSSSVKVVNTTTGQTLVNTTLAFGAANISPGASVVRTFAFTLPSSAAGVGRIEVSIFADSTGWVSEYNSFGTGESNNGSSIAVTSTQGLSPDLVVRNLSVSPSSLISGQTVTINWDDFNAGDGGANGTWSDWVRVVNKTTGQTLLNSMPTYSTNSIPAGGAVARSFQFALPSGFAGTGNLELTVTADHANNLFEFNGSGDGETNNLATLAITSTLQPYANFVIENIVTEATGIFGSVAPLTYTVKNTGTAAAAATGNWNDRVYLSVDGVLGAGDILLATVDAGSDVPLAVDATYTKNLSVALPLNESVTPGNYRIIVVSDATNAVTELSETDNHGLSAAMNISLPPIADLTVSNVSIPTNAFAGERVNVTWTITNAGNGPASGTWVDRVYLSSDQTVGGDAFSANFTFTGTINAGQSIARQQSIQLPQDLTGTYFAIVATDVNNQIFEYTSESNNTRASLSPIMIGTVRSPNLQVTTGSVVAPATTTAGQQKIITWAVRNVGTAATSTPVWQDAVYLSADQILDSGDRPLGSVDNANYLNPNDSYSNSLNVTVPVDLVGDYYFIVKTDDGGSFASNGTVSEISNEGDNWTPSAIRTTIAPAITADLEMINVTAPLVAGTGETITINWTVRNNGAVAPPNSWQDFVYLSKDNSLDASDTYLGYRPSNQILGPGQSYQASYTQKLPANLTPGTYYLFVWANPSATGHGSNFFEQNTANNLSYNFLSTNVTLVAPDLELESVDAPASATSGQSMAVTYTVRNFGNSTTAGWGDSFYLSSDTTLNTATDISIGSRNHYGLGQDDSYTNTVTLSIPNGLQGTYYVFAVADSGNSVFELSETNNEGFDSVPVAVVFNPPDLVVASSSLPNSAAQAGGSLLINWSVKNQGVGSTLGNWTDGIVLSSDNVLGNADDLTLQSSGNASQLLPNQSYAKLSINVPISFSTSSGNYFVFVVTDIYEQILEGTGEGNNASVGMPLTITRQVPDLQVTAATASLAVASGAGLTVNWTVANLGAFQTNTNSWTDAVYLSADTTLSGDDYQLGTRFRSGGLGATGQYDAAATYTIPIDLSGVYHVIVKADSSNGVVEDTFENNNTRSTSLTSQITLTATPDLTIGAISPPGAAYAGQEFSLTYAVNNIGGAINSAVNANGSWYDAVYLSADQVFDRSTDTQVGNVQVSGLLAANTTYYRTANFTIPQGYGGNFYVFVETDSGNRVFERSAEGNNIDYASSPIIVSLAPPADLAVGSITIPSNSAPGQFVSMTYTVTNNGTSTALGTWFDSLYISADDQWDIGDSFFARVQQSGPLAPGASYTRTANAPLPGVLPGNYHVIVRSDIRNAVPESDETNNFGASFDSFNISPQLLALDAPVTSSLSQGNAAYYRVFVPAGETLLINFDSSSTTASNELYVRFGQMPTRSVFDYAFTNQFSPDQKVVVPSSQGGTYYIFAYGDKVTSTPNFTITASTPQFSLFDSDYGTASNRGRITLKLNGAKFTSRTVARIRLGGTTLNAVDSWLGDSATLYATFDLKGATLGHYDVIIFDPIGGTATVPASLNVLHGRGANINAYFNGAPNVVLGRTYPLQLRYGNTGDSDGLAPLVTLTGATGIPFGLTPNTMQAGQSIQFLAINSSGPAGTFRPGDEAGTQLFFRSAVDPTKINLSVITADDDTAIDWASLKDTLKSETINSDAWNAVFSVVTAPLATWGDFVTMLNDNASYLSQLGQRVSDLTTLWTFEVQQAIGLSPLSTIASAVDASMPAPGVSLELDRSFGNTIVSRYGMGMFGRGWSTVWDTYAVTNGDGSVSIFDATGLRRKFMPDNGTFTGSAGDSGVLSTAGGGYLIRETAGSVTSFRADGKIGYLEDTNGNRITATWTNGRLTEIDHSSGQALLLSYNAAGRIASVTDSGNRTTTYTFDASNQHLLTVTAPDGKAITYSYVSGQGVAGEHALASVTSGGVTRTFTYQSDGKLDKTYVANNQELVDFNYDTAAEVMVVDAAAGETDFYYDHRQLLTRVDDALGNTTLAKYGEDLRISQLIDPIGQTRSFTWCSCGMPTSITDEAGNKTTFDPEYIVGKPFKRMASFTDANNHKTSYTYDSKGNLLTTVYADGSVESLGNYDASGNAKLYTNRRGQPLSYTYNAAGQVLRQTFADNTHTDFAYDTRGNLLTVTDATGVTTYTYDYANTGDRLRRVTYPNSRYLDYSYDSAGRRSKMVDQTGFMTQYDYDAAGRLWHVRDGNGAALATYAYDAAGRLSRIDKGNGTYTTYQYDADGQILHLINFAPGGTVSTRFDYTYDKLGRRTSMATVDGTWTYTYDKIGQLTHAVFASTNVAIANQDLQYVYDAVGNRVRTILNGVTADYTTNSINEYTSVGGQAYQYDADGNLLFDGVNTYTYDQQNNLVGVTGPAGITQYEYNSIGDRVASIVNGNRTDFLADATGIGDQLASFSQSETTHFIYGIGLLGDLGVSGFEFLNFDGTGNRVATTGSNGVESHRVSYTPFGQVLGNIQVDSHGLFFAAQYGLIQDTEGRYYDHARTYSSVIGRFHQADPIGIAGSDINLYRYGHNDPISLVDPTGLSSVSVSGGGYAGPGGGVAVAVNSNGSVCISGETGFGGGGGFSIDYSESNAESGEQVGIELKLEGGPFEIGGSGTLTKDGRGSIEKGASKGFLEPKKRGRPPKIPKLKVVGKVFVRATRCTPPIWEDIKPPDPSTFTVDDLKTHFPGLVGSFDPNDILGPAGFGSDHWIAADQRGAYTIQFENQASLATAPAHVVHITQTLDSDFDPRTFRVGDFGFGSIVIHVPDGRSFYTTRLDLTATLGIYVDFAAGIDVSTGAAFWQLTSIDPLTGDVPLDPSKGFLPPNEDGLEGQGYVQYSVRPKTTAQSGDLVTARASIVFDINAPIDTPTISNKLDAGKPTSSVQALPVSNAASFVVNWLGSDDVNGSALASYTIYVSQDGGAFTPWLTDTTLTQSTYVGQPGRRYAFYSIAKDNAGNVENAPTVPDATTSVVASTVVRRGIFYNNSALDGNSAAANAADDAAIATDKQALLPGQTATFANYTSFSKGINGLMIDLSSVGGTLSSSDFIFKVGNTTDPTTWATAPAPISIVVRDGAGQNGSQRVEIIWADNAIQKQWLQVTIKANANTGLSANDVFYFGNAIGDSGLGNTSAYALVNSTDQIAARNNATAAANANNVYDFNRDGKVDAADELIVKQNGTTAVNALKLFTAPAAPAGKPSRSGIAGGTIAADGKLSVSSLGTPLASRSLFSSIPVGSSARASEWLDGRLEKEELRAALLI